MYIDDDKKEIGLLKLSEEDKKKKIKELRTKLNKIKKDNSKYREEREKLYSKIKDEWQLEKELSILTHNFKRNDIVLLNTQEIAEIEQLVQTYHYKVFVHCTGLRGGLGTKRKVHEKEILCHINDLLLERVENIKYKQKGYRRINFL